VGGKEFPRIMAKQSIHSHLTETELVSVHNF
jgi:hypothetical protein